MRLFLLFFNRCPWSLLCITISADCEGQDAAPGSAKRRRNDPGRREVDGLFCLCFFFGMLYVYTLLSALGSDTPMKTTKQLGLKNVDQHTISNRYETYIQNRNYSYMFMFSLILDKPVTWEYMGKWGYQTTVLLLLPLGTPAAVSFAWNMNYSFWTMTTHHEYTMVHHITLANTQRKNRSMRVPKLSRLQTSNLSKGRFFTSVETPCDGWCQHSKWGFP